MSKIIRNVNILDMSNATMESLEGITAIENVNLLLYHERLVPALTKTSLRNVNLSVAVPSGVMLVNGSCELNKGILSSRSEPLAICVNGRTVVQPDVTEDLLHDGLGLLLVNGKIYCPERLVGELTNKMRSPNCKVIPYMDDAELVMQNAQVNNQFLQSLNPGTKLVFMRAVKMTDDLDQDLLRERIARVEFLGEAYVREEFLTVLNSKLHNRHRCELNVIPSGAQFVDDDLVLDDLTVSRFDQADVYMTGDLRISDKVTVADLEKSIHSLHVGGKVICRKELKVSVYQRCDDVNVSFLDYSGKLLMIDGEYKLTKSELVYTPEKLGLVVSGILNISENVDPELLADKVESVANSGIIKGTEEQCGVIRAKMISNTGLVEDADDEVKENADAGFIGNMNILTL